MRKSKSWKKKLSAMITATLCLWGGCNTFVYALPTDNHDMQNIKSVTSSSSVMNILGKGSSLNSVIKWGDFSIANGETVNFSQMKSILNLVDGHNISKIYGSLNAPNIDVFLLNPNGVIFGAGSQVDAGSLTVSARTLSEDAITDLFLMELYLK